MDKNYYKILGLKEDATSSEIKKAYLKKAKEYHPDVCKDKDAEEKFKKINEAYGVLKNENTKKEYDDSLKYNTSFESDESFNQDEIINNVFALFKVSNKNISYFSNYVKTKFDSEKKLFEAFQLFWMSLWSGGKNTGYSFQNKNASKIFYAFSEHPLTNLIVKSLVDEINSNPHKKQTFNEFKQTLLKINSSFPEENFNNPNYFHQMQKIINQQNFFDEIGFLFWFMVTKKNTYDLLKKFEKIFEANKDQKFKTNGSSEGELIIMFVILLAILLWAF